MQKKSSCPSRPGWGMLMVKKKDTNPIQNESKKKIRQEATRKNRMQAQKNNPQREKDK